MTRQQRDELCPWLQYLTNEQVWKIWLMYVRAMTRQQRDEEFPWLQYLTDEQVWKIWLMYDRLGNWKGYAPCTDYPITTHDEAISIIGPLLRFGGPSPEQLEIFEDELQRDEEYKLAGYMRKLRHLYERPEDERKRYEREDELFEELGRRRQRRRPRAS
jgi:hypothetical protein